jgi:hemerythrin-like domain-containing protein
MKITEALVVEHHLLRTLMDAMSQWLADGVADDVLRERAAILEVAIDDHAAREEQQLFAPLCAAHTIAREQVDLMEVVHSEVRDLFAEVADPAHTVKERLWTILMLTTEHFTKEENAVFPMAEKLMGTSLPEARSL